MISTEQLTNGVAWYIAFLLSITCHEAAHAFAADVGGDSTAKDQVTLNPIPHMQREPFGTVLIPLSAVLMGRQPFGWASAPYNPYWAVRYPRRAVVMTLAGPFANLLLALIAAVMLEVGIYFGAFDTPASVNYTRLVQATSPMFEGAAFLLSILISLNLLLCVFNLLPVPPLDGFGVLTHITHGQFRESLEQARRSPGMMIVGILIASKVLDGIFPYVFDVALWVLFPWTSYG